MLGSAASVPVTFEPSGRTVWVAPGTTALVAARKAGVDVVATCGGRGTCGACGVRVVQGELGAVSSDEAVLLARAPRDVRMACRAEVVSPVVLRPVIDADVTSVAEGAEGVAGALVAGVDLGTTTVAAAVVDPVTGAELGRSVVLNGQAPWGADVLARLSAAMQGDGEDLRVAAEDSVLKALDMATGARLGMLERVVIAANTAMATLLCGADVTPLSRYPFAIPKDSDRLPAHSRLREALPTCEIVVVPAIASFVGGDAAAGAVAHRILESDTATVLVDIGTNAEVVVASRGCVWVSSAAAGPAFEGGTISHGGPAVPGAITSVEFRDGGGVAMATIGDQEPRWMSGAGLVSCVAQMLRSRDLAADGAMVADGPHGIRMRRDDAGVIGIDITDTGSVRVTQLDIRAFQLAKAAVRVALDMTLGAAGVKDAGVGRVLVAGAFGAALDARDLVDLGVVSAGLKDVLVPVGNASLEGAVAIALDESLLEQWIQAASGVESVELASDPAFTERLIAALSLECSYR